MKGKDFKEKVAKLTGVPMMSAAKMTAELMKRYNGKDFNEMHALLSKSLSSSKADVKLSALEAIAQMCKFPVWKFYEEAPRPYKMTLEELSSLKARKDTISQLNEQIATLNKQTLRSEAMLSLALRGLAQIDEEKMRRKSMAKRDSKNINI